MLRNAAGRSAVFLLAAIARLPIRIILAAGSLLLPLYIPFRRTTRERLAKLDPPVAPLAYYRMRLHLALLSLRHLLGMPDGCATVIEGSGLLADALASGKPVALLGWHQGPVELLHKIPAGRAEGRPFFTMTASAFSPALAAWMARGRSAGGIRVIRPDETGALRAWTRGSEKSAVLALMTDQVPGVPENWTVLRAGKLLIPWPRRLMDWVAARDPVCLAVSARLEPGNRIVFRYDRLNPGAWQEEVARLMEAALARAPDQYNWSYPKVRVE